MIRLPTNSLERNVFDCRGISVTQKEIYAKIYTLNFKRINQFNFQVTFIHFF